jgi:hypothetical protein
MSAPTTTEMPLLGRCKECDYALFVAPGQNTVEAESFRDVKGDGRAYRVGNDGFFGRCPNRHKLFALKRIKGTYSADHKCDARCLNAKGHTCTCSCGGLNHGRGFAVTNIVEASDRPVTQAAQQAVAVAEPATERQINFIKKLLDEREMPGKTDAAGHYHSPEARKTTALDLVDLMTKRQASKTIEWLLSLPEAN